MHTQKNALRKHMKEGLAQFPAEQRCAFSEEASRHLLESDVWAASRTICLFVNYGVEIETRLLLNNAWEQGKNVYLPKCWAHKEGEMDFFLCNSIEDLEPGLYGIMEPSKKTMERGRMVDSPELIVVPGLAFTSSGMRLGKGGGYYDRFMVREMCRTAKRVGFGFSMQVVESLPTETWDLLLHYVCTEKAMKRTPEPFERDGRVEYD